ncbi:hypothetical protein LTR27_009023 [Elasticomyces elasticus]|nr:hypothetical protein LTR27_009023 [Elasticomyces elasticus]
MALLELRQELLDEIAFHLDAFALLALRQTGKHVYHALGGNANLHKAFITLETYWASDQHGYGTWHDIDVIDDVPDTPNADRAHADDDSDASGYVDDEILDREHKRNCGSGQRCPQPEPYPPYEEYLGRAPCYTCLRISMPGNTHDTWGHTIHGENPEVPWWALTGLASAGKKYLDLFATCAAKYTVDRAPLPRQQRAGLCLPCFKVANPGWVEFKTQLELRVSRIKRYKHALGAGKSERALLKLAKALDPRTTESELPLDWALWRYVYEPVSESELQDRTNMLRALDYKYKLRGVESQMDRYLMWMRFIDDRERVCPHKVVPPAVDKLLELGEWPKWKHIAEDLRDTVKGWGAAECGLGCKLEREVEVWSYRHSR